MKIKVFSAMTDDSLEKKANRFLETLAADSRVRVADVQFSANAGGLSVMIVYEEEPPQA